MAGGAGGGAASRLCHQTTPATASTAANKTRTRKRNRMVVYLRKSRFLVRGAGEDFGVRKGGALSQSTLRPAEPRRPLCDEKTYPRWGGG